jgi:putative ABC transport system permease protein
MTMDFTPILASLKRHKIAASLIVLEVALTCAILCNAVFLIGQRVERTRTATGIAEADLIVLGLGRIGAADNADAVTRQDMAALRGTSGVAAATVVGQVPYGSSLWMTGLQLAPVQEHPTIKVALYEVGEDWLKTLGVRLAEGRDFLPDEYRMKSQVDKDPAWPVPASILTRATAERLFPGGRALGQTVYLKGAPTRVVGVVEQLAGPRPADPIDRFVALAPVRPSYRTAKYLVRAEPGRRDALLQTLAATLQQVDGHRIIEAPVPLEERRERHYQQDRAMARLLVAVCAALVAVTAFGIVGLATFWVQQRTRMIGTRRALGASRWHILRYFQAENFLLTSLGVALGMAGAYGVNQLLMLHYEVPRLPWAYLPAGALAMWALGQLAVLGPALRAAALPPVAALRSS